MTITGTDGHFLGYPACQAEHLPDLDGVVPPADNSGQVVFTDSAGVEGTAPANTGQASTVLYSSRHAAGTLLELSAAYVSNDGSVIDTTSRPVPLDIISADWSIAKYGAPTTQLLEDHGDDPGLRHPQRPGGHLGANHERHAIQANELWQYNPIGSSGYGHLINEQSGKCLEVNGSNGNVDQWDCVAGATNELWAQVPNPTGGDALQVESSGSIWPPPRLRRRSATAPG